jgi:hypothetical protein
MNVNLLNQSLRFCSALDSVNEFEKSDKIFKIATTILSQTKGYDPANPLTLFTDPTNVERSEGIPGSEVVFLEDDLFQKIKDIPERFKNIKMQDFTSWLSTFIPFFDPSKPQEIEEFRRRIFPTLRRRDPAFWADFKILMTKFNEYLTKRSLPEEITGDPVKDQIIKDRILQNIRNIVGSPIMSVINDELDESLIP